MVHLINFGNELNNETIIGKCARSTNFYMRDNLIYNYIPLRSEWVHLTLGCLAVSSSQPGHHGVSAISNNLYDPGRHGESGTIDR